MNELCWWALIIKRALLMSEYLLLTRQTGNLKWMGKPLNMTARIVHRIGIRPKKHRKPRARVKSGHDEVWSKRSNPKPCLWSNPRRRVLNIVQVLNVATYNVRTLADTTRETNRGIRNKLQRIIAGCEEQNFDIIAIQEHRLTSSNPINYQRLVHWTLAHTTSSLEYHGVAH